MPDDDWVYSGPTFADSGPEYLGSTAVTDGGPLMPYTYTHSSSSPTTSPSSIPANIRIPRYLRRYSISPSTSLHLPTSPLASSLVPDDYYFGDRLPQQDVGSSCGHVMNTPNDHPSFNPGPNVHRHRQTATVISAAPLSDTGAHFPKFDANHACASDLALVRTAVVTSGTDPSSHSFTRPRSSSITSSASVYSSDVSSLCSFYTATGDDVHQIPEINQAMHHQDIRDSLPFPYVLGEQTALEEDNPWSWLGLTPPQPVQNHSSDSSGSGSGSGFVSRGGFSSSDTEREPPIDNNQAAAKTDSLDYGLEWPLAYLTSVREELQRENVPRREGRRFSWGEGSFRSRRSKRSNKGLSTVSLDALGEREQDSDRISTKSRKLKKKKRPESTGNPPQPIGFDEVNEQPPHDESGRHVQVDLDSTAIVVPEEEKLPKPTNFADGQAVTVESDWHQPLGVEIYDRGERDRVLEDPGHAGDDGVQITREHDVWLEDMSMERVLSRTPQEILQGLDVVHEVTEDEDEEEVTTQEGRRLQVDKTSQWEPEGGNRLIKGEEYPAISHKGKEKAVEHPQETIIVEGSRSQVLANTHERERDAVAKMNGQDEDGPITLDETPSFSKQAPKIKVKSPPRRKLSKKRRSRRALRSPPVPTPAVGGQKSRSRKSLGAAPRRPSVPTLRPRRTPKTLLSSVRVNFFRSVGLMLGIGRADEKRRSRELRTPNTLVLGRHFTGKYIPRFPSRLDGLRSVDKKIATYE